MFDGVQLFGHAGNADWANVFLRDLAQGFRDLGVDSLFTDVETEGWDPVTRFCSSVRAFIIDINGRADVGEFWKFSLVVDHPLAHPQLRDVNALTVLGTIDAAHAQINGYSRAPAVFVPHGGPTLQARPDDPRDIDVVFIGNILKQRQPANDFEDLALEAGRRVADRAADPALSLIGLLAENGIGLPQLNAADFAHLLNIASGESQRLSRIAAVTSIRGCRLVFAGRVPPDVQDRMDPDTRFMGHQISFTEGCALMRRAKVVLNVAQKFPCGSHERIWYGMAAGAAVVTNRSTFVEQSFRHGQHILFYDTPGQVGELVARALQGDAARRLAEAAVPIYLDRHTWRERASRIMTTMNYVALTRRG